MKAIRVRKTQGENDGEKEKEEKKWVKRDRESKKAK